MHDKTIRRRRAVLGLLVVVSLILLTDYFGESPSSPLHSVQRGIVEVLSPLQAGASKVLSPVRDVANWISTTLHAKSQNSQLVLKNDALNKQLSQYQYDAAQYQQDQKLLKLDDVDKLKTYAPVAANVTGVNPTIWYQTIEVNRGSDSGIAQYDPVVAPGGLVGDVSEVGPGYSIVTLLSSPQFAVGAQILNPSGSSVSTSAGVLKPAVGNPDTLVLNYLSSTDQVQVGDEVVTSGFKDPGDPTVESFAPAGIPIGQVSNADAQSTVATNQQVDVSPTASLTHLSTVQILTKPHGSS